MTRFIFSCIFTCSALALSAQGTQLAEYLHKNGSAIWELRTIVWEDGSSMESEEFGEGEDDAFTLENDDATIIPETIVFNADGTCIMYYVAHYEETEDGEDEELEEGLYEVHATWKIENGNNVRIMEPEENDGDDDGLDDAGLDPYPGYCWHLNKIVAKNGTFSCVYDWYGFTSGISKLVYEQLEEEEDKD